MLQPRKQSNGRIKVIKYKLLKSLSLEIPQILTQQLRGTCQIISKLTNYFQAKRERQRSILFAFCILYRVYKKDIPTLECHCALIK
jgi:hypothetical protein